MSGSPVEIPLIAAGQTFSVMLAGVSYNMTVRWNIPAACWMLDIADTNDNPILSGLPMITGADLLEQYGYLNIGGQLIVSSDNDPNQVPTYTSLGTLGHLYFIPNS